MMTEMTLDRIALGTAPPPHRRYTIPPDLVGWVLRGVDVAIIALVAAGLSIDRHVMMVALLLYPGLASLAGAYDADSLFSMRRAVPRMSRSWGASILFTVSFQIILNSQIPIMFPRATLWVIVTLALLLTVRGGATTAICRLRHVGHFNHRLAIYGATMVGIELHHHVVSHASLTLDVVGVYDERSPARLNDVLQKIAFRGGLDELIADIRHGQIDQVIIALPWSDDIYVRNVISRLTLTPVRIRVLPDTALFAYPQRPMVVLGDIPMMTLFERPISGLDALIKRFEDIVLAALFILGALPILLITACAIKIGSPGPVFFRQPREGFNNQRFRIWKFRSMFIDQDQSDSIRQATRHDPRITRVGQFIRRTSIDELPQLFNVLTGEMSIVGPRPHAPSTRAGERLFPDVINTYAARHKVKPGITGWAQVCGWRGETDTEDKLINRVNHDLYYIEHWSVWFDFYIMARTVFALIGSHAY